MRPPTIGPCSASPVHSSLGAVGLEPAERPPAAAPSGRVVELRARTKWRCRVRSPRAQPGVRAQDPPDLRRGPGRVLPLQRRRQLQHLRRGPRLRPAAGRAPARRTRRAATPGSTGPAGPGDPHRPPERAGVLARGELRGPAGPAGAWTRRVRGVADQPVAEQPHLPGPVSANVPAVFTGVVMPCSVCHRGLHLLGRSRRDQQAEGCRRRGGLPRVSSCWPPGRGGPELRGPAADHRLPGGELHAGRGPNNRAAAAAANPRTSSASPNTEPVGAIAARNGSSAWSSPVNNTRTPRAAAESTQPATHGAHGRPTSTAIGRCPRPVAFASSADRSPARRPPAETSTTRQQHVRGASPRAPRTTRTWTHLRVGFRSLAIWHSPRASARRRTPGQRKSTTSQDPVDLDRVRTYHQHRVPPSTKQRPSLPVKDSGGPLRFHDVVTLSSRTKKGNPRGRPSKHRQCQ